MEHESIDVNNSNTIITLKSPIDNRDWIFENLAKGYSSPKLDPNDGLPEEFHLYDHTQPSRDQGDRGTCSAFTAAMIKEIQANRENGFNEHMSPEFIYYHRENKPSNGMYARNVFQILQKVGSVSEKDFPYMENDDNVPEPPKNIYKKASIHRISNYARVKTCVGLKHALNELGPCYLLLPLYTSRPEFWRPINGEQYSGGHSTTVIGYTKQGFILKNSWGEDWNDKGCVIFPFEDWDIHWECWTPISNTNIKPETKSCTIL
jgi:C1A family cysteine protease